MKRLAALIAAIALTLVMAAPAVANQKVWIEQFSTDGPIEYEQLVDTSTCSGPPDWEGWCEPWQCTKPIYYGGSYTGNLWLWYPNDVDEADMMPTNRAWPWIKGKSEGYGVDYFSSKPGKSGKVVSGKFKFNGRNYNHEWDENGETWMYQETGKVWGVNVPGKGTTFHLSGNYREQAVLVWEDGVLVSEDYFPIRFRGNENFDVDELCEYLGAGPAITFD